MRNGGDTKPFFFFLRFYSQYQIPLYGHDGGLDAFIFFSSLGQGKLNGGAQGKGEGEARKGGTIIMGEIGDIISLIIVRFCNSSRRGCNATIHDFPALFPPVPAPNVCGGYWYKTDIRTLGIVFPHPSIETSTSLSPLLLNSINGNNSTHTSGTSKPVYGPHVYQQ